MNAEKSTEGIKREIEGVKESASRFDATLRSAIETGQAEKAEELQKDIKAKIAGIREKIGMIDTYQIALRDRIAKEHGYGWISGFHDKVAIARRLDKIYCLIGTSGERITDEGFLEINEFHEGIARVQKADGFYFVNKSGEQIGTEGFMHAGDFHDGVAWVREKRTGFYFYINASGKRICEEGPHSSRDFHEGIGAVLKPDGFYYYINPLGEVIIPEGYEPARDFSEGIAKVSYDARDWYYINQRGERIIAETFRGEPGDFHNGVARVRIGFNGLWYYINTSGERIFEEGLLEGADFVEGVGRVRKEDDLYYFINTSGEQINSEGYVNASDFDEGIARVQKGNGLWYFINTKGEQIFDEGYYLSTSFNEGVAWVGKSPGHLFPINKLGERIGGNETYSFVFDFSEGVAKVKCNGEEYYIDRKGRRVFS